MANLIHCIKNKIPVLLEGTAKTRKILIASKYIQIFYEKKEEDNLIRFNLSQETKIDDLISKYVGSKFICKIKNRRWSFFKSI